MTAPFIFSTVTSWPALAAVWEKGTSVRSSIELVWLIEFRGTT